jgi:hypothetical protein
VSKSTDVAQQVVVPVDESVQADVQVVRKLTNRADADARHPSSTASGTGYTTSMTS